MISVFLVEHACYTHTPLIFESPSSNHYVVPSYSAKYYESSHIHSLRKHSLRNH